MGKRVFLIRQYIIDDSSKQLNFSGSFVVRSQLFLHDDCTIVQYDMRVLNAMHLDLCVFSFENYIVCLHKHQCLYIKTL